MIQLSWAAMEGFDPDKNIRQKKRNLENAFRDTYSEFASHSSIDLATCADLTAHLSDCIVGKADIMIWDKDASPRINKRVKRMVKFMRNTMYKEFGKDETDEALKVALAEREKSEQPYLDRYEM